MAGTWLGGTQMSSPCNSQEITKILDQSIVHLLHRASQRASELFAKAAGPEGLTPRQFAVLAAAASKEGMSQTDLVKATGVDRSTLGQIVHRMAERGLLDRRQMPNDQRAFAVRPTDKGRQLIAQYTPLSVEVDGALLKAMPADTRGHFLATLKDIADRIGLARPVSSAGDRDTQAHGEQDMHL